MTSLTILQARIKLQTRHLLEWDTLAAQQQLVLALVRDEYHKKLSAAKPDNGAFMAVNNQKTSHLLKLMSRQQDERQQLRTRQGQEDACLAGELYLPV